MTFQGFQSTFRHYPLFSIKEIEKLYPAFDFKNLAYWQKKNYVQKIRNSWYRLTENSLNAEMLYFISNHIYHPSYISMETALSFYGFIPEGVFKTTAISTLKTQEFTTPAGVFNYRNVKPELYFGYRLISFDRFNFKIAEPEKTILDYLYLNSELNSEEHFFELRFNTLEIKRQINVHTFYHYLAAFDSKALTARTDIFIKFLNYA